MKFLSDQNSSNNSDGAAEGRSIVDFFEAAVDTYREATALDSAGRKVSYLELDRRANHISAYVLAQHPDTSPVALMFQDDLLSVSSIFGVLKAGKAFVFLNPAYPTERIASILEDVKPGLILTETRYVETLSGLRPLAVEDISGFDFSTEVGRPSLQISPDAPAYIIYTSGSTGIPKGCLFTHRMVLHDNDYVTSDAGITPADRFGMLTALSFVASRAGLYGALLNGAALCMHELSNSDPGRIVAWLDESQISILYTTPSLFRNIFSAVPAGHIFQSLRTVHVAGEKVTAAEVDLFREHTRQDAFLLVVYGQTETGRVARFPVWRDTNWNSASVPVGNPLPGKEVILLREDGEPVKVGEVGDIVVRSAYIPRGYFGNADTARQGFVTDPDDPNLRLFHTGDIGRQTDDGVLIYLGRKDNQVKINGQRMELGEVEAALLAQADIQSALVMARPAERSAGQATLIAYVVAKAGRPVTAEQLRGHLSRLLPAYMIPSRFIFIPAMPFSLHGKIDLRSLPNPDNRPELNEADLPVDDVEKHLVDVWKRILKLETVGVNDSFFELGGDSLQAALLFTEIVHAFKKDYPLSILWQHGTIRKLSGLIQSTEMIASGHVIPLRSEGTLPPLFIVPGGGSDLIGLLDLVRALGEDQPVYGLQDIRADSQRSIYFGGLSKAAEEYICAMKAIQPRGPYHLAGHSFGGLVAFEMARQLSVMGDAVGLLGLLDTFPPAPKRRSGTLKNRLQTHAKNLAGRNLRGKLGYLSERFNLFLNRLIRQNSPRRFYDSKLVRGLLGPDSLQSVRAALVDYIPVPYEGNAVIYRVTQRPLAITWDVTAPWAELILGGIEFHDIPSEHKSMIKPPHVDMLAGFIKRDLELFAKARP